MPSNEPSPRPWRLESDNLTLNPPVWFIVDANGAKVTGGFFLEADARLIVDAVNERDRLRDLVRRLADDIERYHLVGERDRALLREARSALEEGGRA